MTAPPPLLPLRGRARVFPAHVSTDAIIASHRKRDSLDPAVLRAFLFEHLAPGFGASLLPGDMIVAGANFGCGSAMEVAVTVFTGNGIRAVVAASFARTYYRNAVNNGLLPLIADTSAIAEGDPIEVRSAPAGWSLVNLRTGTAHPAEPLPPLLLALAAAGGLVPYLAAYGEYPFAASSALRDPR